MIADPLLKGLHAAAVIGSVAIDRNVIGDRTFLKVGGVATYAGLTYRHHGLPTWVVCNLAPSDTAILSPLLNEGIQVLSGDSQRTTHFVNRLREGMRTQQTPSLAAPIRLRQLAAVPEHVDCIHLGPLHPEDIETQVYARLQNTDTLVVLDVQGLVRKSDRGRVVMAVSDRLAAGLRAANIVKADQDELGAILDAFGSDLEALMERFDIAEWVVTSGAKGGCIHGRGARHYAFEPVPAAAAVDPTGAGDVFISAYTVARFQLRQTVAAASRHAARMSADHVAGRFIPAGLLDLASLRSAQARTRPGVDNNRNAV